MRVLMLAGEEAVAFIPPLKVTLIFVVTPVVIFVGSGDGGGRRSGRRSGSRTSGRRSRSTTTKDRLVRERGRNLAHGY